jgi:hypothetical protein
MEWPMDVSLSGLVGLGGEPNRLRKRQEGDEMNPLSG